MEIEKNNVIGLTFELKVSKTENDIESVPFSVEVRDQDDPFYFVFGNSGLPEKFEELLAGKKKGDSFSFVIEANDAYGQPDEELILNIPKSHFSKERGFSPEMLQEGNFLPLIDDNQLPMQAKILKDQGTDLLLDFNHPLVGFDLHFEGEVLTIRNASKEELATGLVEGAN
ncbi:FKBP-type peptidyl-prolyl cis-trans isomerase [Algoriphagus namhaensis]